ncbi:MAG: PAS domain-containing sensor histidine kinase [Bacteroidetes bacterium]|nr:PAS domain-containing sensor histidine kinase [Bacteroidota bacterium]
MIGNFFINRIFQIWKSFLTERKSKREKERQAELMFADVFQTLFNLTREGFIICNSAGAIKEINESCCGLLQLAKEELLEKSIADFLLNQENYAVLNPSELLATKEPKLICLKQKNGTLLPAEIIIRKVSDEKFLLVINHEIIAHLNYDEISKELEELQFNKDLLEERSAELNILSTQLAQSETELKELNASKDKFFSILAHDLKSPFSGLLGYMDMLVEDFDSLQLDEIKSYINSVHTMVGNIYSLTKNLLDWSRLQNGRMECNIERRSLYEAVTYAESLVNANAQNKGISIINNVGRDEDVLADNMMLNLVFQNLLSNAIKFTPRGGQITISSKPINIFHEISIADSGIGMSEETLQKIFRIESVHTTLGTEKEKGTGLGLILCKEMIERQKGALSVESKVNEGTKFSFILPSAYEKEIKRNNTSDVATIIENA